MHNANQMCAKIPYAVSPTPALTHGASRQQLNHGHPAVREGDGLGDGRRGAEVLVLVARRRVKSRSLDRGKAKSASLLVSAREGRLVSGTL